MYTVTNLCGIKMLLLSKLHSVKTVFVQFHIHDGMALTLVMHFNTFHYLINFWKYFVDCV